MTCVIGLSCVLLILMLEYSKEKKVAFDGAEATAAGQMIPSKAPTVVTFSGVTYDASFYWNAGSPTKLTIPNAGKYRVTLGGRWGKPPADVHVTLTVYQNATPVLSDNRYYPMNFNNPTQGGFSRVLDCAAGDVITAQAFQTTLGNLSLDAVLEIQVEQ